MKSVGKRKKEDEETHSEAKLLQAKMSTFTLRCNSDRRSKIQAKRFVCTAQRKCEARKTVLMAEKRVAPKFQ